MLANSAGFWESSFLQLRTDIRPVIKHRELYPLDMAHKAHHDGDTYHRRLIVEAFPPGVEVLVR